MEDTAPQASRPAPRVLVVDDEPQEQQAVRALLEEAGYVVETVGDGEAGLARLSADRPDLLVVDLIMPGIDGPTLIRAARRDLALGDLPIILLTDKTYPSDGPSFDAGADMRLCKPFNPKELLSFIKRLLSTDRNRTVVYDLSGPPDPRD